MEIAVVTGEDNEGVLEGAPLPKRFHEPANPFIHGGEAPVLFDIAALSGEGLRWNHPGHRLSGVFPGTPLPAP